MGSPEQETILILDDDDDFVEAMSDLIGTFGRSCLGVGSLGSLKDEAQRALRCELAILDINLGPGLPSGLDAYAWLREHDFGGRIVFLTGHGRSHPLVARANASGATVLQKPISVAALRVLAQVAP